MAPAVGFEPTTKRLTAARSTTELRRSGSAGRSRSKRAASPPSNATAAEPAGSLAGPSTEPVATRPTRIGRA